MIRRFFISGYQMLSAVTLRAATALILNKIVAITSGPAGVTLFSHLQNLIAITTQLPHDGINKGFIKLFHDVDKEEQDSLLKQVVIVNLIITILTLLVVFFARDYFWSKFGSEISQGLILTFSFASIFIVWYYTFLAYFQAQRYFKEHALISSITSLFVLLTCSSILYYKGFDSFMIAFLISQSSGFAIAVAFYLKDGRLSLFFRKLNVPKERVKHLMEYIAMAFSVLLFTYFADFVIRNYAIEAFGTSETGLWQSVVRLSDYYKAFYIAIVGAIFYAEVAANISNPTYIRKYFRRILLVITPLLLVVLFFIHLLGDYILILLYDNEFVTASTFFPYQLAGDFFSLIAFLFVYILMAQKRTLTFIAVQAASTIVYLIIIFQLIPFFELHGIVMAHFYRNIFFLALVVVVNRKVLL